MLLSVRFNWTADRQIYWRLPIRYANLRGPEPACSIVEQNRELQMCNGHSSRPREPVGIHAGTDRHVMEEKSEGFGWITLTIVF